MEGQQAGQGQGQMGRNNNNYSNNTGGGRGRYYNNNNTHQTNNGGYQYHHNQHATNYYTHHGGKGSHHSVGGGGRDYHHHTHHRNYSNNAGFLGLSDMNNNHHHQGGNNGYRAPTLATWRGIMRKRDEVMAEKAKCLGVVEPQEKPKLPLQFRKIFPEKEGDVNRKSPTEGLENDEKKDKSGKVEIDMVELEVGGKGEEIPPPHSAVLGKNNSSTASSAESLIKIIDEEQRGEKLRSLTAKEKKVEGDIQRFLQDVDRYLQVAEKRLIDQKMMSEVEHMQAMTYMQQRIVSLEEKNRAIPQLQEQLEFYRQMIQQIHSSSLSREIELQAEKESAVAKAKVDTLAQLLALPEHPTLWHDPFITCDPKLKLNMSEWGNYHPLLSSASFYSWTSNSSSPCLHPIPSANGQGMVTDLRDRYEDVKCFGYVERSDKTEGILKMIKKVVNHYENKDMRVYEELLSSQFVSTLMWCENDSLYPQHEISTFAIGYGQSQFEATESALQRAYDTIVQSEKDITEESSPSEEPGPTQGSEYGTHSQESRSTSITSSTSPSESHVFLSELSSEEQSETGFGFTEFTFGSSEGDLEEGELPDSDTSCPNTSHSSTEEIVTTSHAAAV